jgi:hypothetical protein
MPERALAAPAAEPEAAAVERATARTDVAARLLGLQRAAGNAATRGLVGQLRASPRAGGRALQRRRDEEPRAAAAALADAVAARRGVQRTVKVADPKGNIPNPTGKGLVQTNAATIESYLKDICSEGSVTVDAASGDVSITASFCNPAPVPAGFVGPLLPSAKSSSTPAGCGCLCDMVGSKHAWTIVVDDVAWPNTKFDDLAAADGVPPGGTGGRVTAPSPNSPKLWGSATKGGGTSEMPSWLVLGHELCGHGWLGDRGAHGPDRSAPRGEGGHQETVSRENLIRGEHGFKLRGTFKDPDCGESYWRDKAGPGPIVWSDYRKSCIAWRADYNKKNGTSYTIADTIP